MRLCSPFSSLFSSPPLPFSPLFFFPSPCVITAPWLEYAYVYSPWREWLTWFFLGFSARGGGQLDLQPEGLSLRWQEGFRLGQAHFELLTTTTTDEDFVKRVGSNSSHPARLWITEWHNLSQSATTAGLCI